MLNSNCKRFVGKVAVLSASTDGIGLAIARRLGQEKAKIVVSSRNIENVTRAVETLKTENIDVIGVKCHISNAEERANLIQEAVKHFGRIDILVANAGVNPHIGKLLDCSEAAWDKTFEVNVKGAFLLIKETIPVMKKQAGGSILLMSTITAYATVPDLSVYATSKLCLTRLAKQFANELAGDNIRVNCLAPGAIDTKFMNNITITEGYKIDRQILNAYEENGSPRRSCRTSSFSSFRRCKLHHRRDISDRRRNAKSLVMFSIGGYLGKGKFRLSDVEFLQIMPT